MEEAKYKFSESMEWYATAKSDVQEDLRRLWYRIQTTPPGQPVRRCGETQEMANIRFLHQDAETHAVMRHLAAECGYDVTGWFDEVLGPYDGTPLAPHQKAPEGS